MEPLQDDKSWFQLKDETYDGWDFDLSCIPEYDSVMQWDDSGAQEALHYSRERKRARDLGITCNAPPLKPDIYNEKIDWNAKLRPEDEEAYRKLFPMEDAKPVKSRRFNSRSYKRHVDAPQHESEWSKSVEITPTGWTSGGVSASKPDPVISGLLNKKNSNVSQEQQRYKNWENYYSRGDYSGGWGNSGSRQQENFNKVWKPKGNEGDWNRRRW